MQLALFIIFGILAVAGALNLLFQRHPINSALSLVVVMMSLAVLYWSLGAEFLAAAQVIVYSGAIMVLFVFVVMMLNLGGAAREMERQWLRPGVWIGPALFAVVLFGEFSYLFATRPPVAASVERVSAKQVGIALFGPYVIGVELVSLLLMGGLVGAYHLGRRTLSQQEELNDARAYRARLIAGGEPVHDRPRRTTHAA